MIELTDVYYWAKNHPMRDALTDAQEAVRIARLEE